MLNKIKRLLGIIALILFLIPSRALAELNLEIVDNGASSQNSVNITQSSTNSVSETNNSQINNQIDVSSNPGQNTASSNSSPSVTQIHTGDIKANLDVNNHLNTNSSSVSECCDLGTQINVSNNGENSSNTINIDNSSINDNKINNYAQVNNQIEINASTGKNTADDNNGTTHIKSGDISINASLVNSINKSNFSLISSNDPTKTNIKNNGEGSTSSITINNHKTNSISVENKSNINDSSIYNLITGNNSAEENIGDTAIISGNIYLSINYQNLLNESTADINACCKETPAPTPPPSPNPTPTPGPVGGPPDTGGGPGGGGGSSNSSSAEAVSQANVGGSVLGLSATSADLNFLGHVVYSLGLICVIYGGKQIAKNQNRVARSKKPGLRPKR